MPGGSLLGPVQLGWERNASCPPRSHQPPSLDGGGSVHELAHHPIVNTTGGRGRVSRSWPRMDGNGVENGHRKAKHNPTYPKNPLWDIDFSGPIYGAIGACLAVMVLTYMALEEVRRPQTNECIGGDG